MEKKLTFKRFFLNKNSLGLMSLMAVILFIIYIALFFVAKLFETVEGLSVFWDMLLDLMLNGCMIILSVLAGAIFSAMLIERRSNDSQRLDTLFNEVLSCTDCLDYMSERNKRLLEKRLTGVEYDVQGDILTEVKGKLFDRKPKFYFEECTYMVTCTVQKDHIEKKITRTVKIRSYEPQCTIKDFPLVKMTNKQIAGLSNLEITRVEINGNGVNANKYKNNGSATQINAPVLLKNNYTTQHCYQYADNLQLKNDKTTTITVTYKTRVEIQDTSYCCRVSEHCKAFHVDFTITNPEKYNISAAAFGFIDTADNTPNNDAKNNIKMSFDKWIFKNDGVCINFQKENS